MSEQLTLIDLLKSSWVAMVGALAWFGKENLRENREEHAAMADRLSALERDRVTKADIERIHERIDQLGTQMNDQHRAILNTLLDWRGGGE
jgi:hypothetical protein